MEEKSEHWPVWTFRIMLLLLCGVGGWFGKEVWEGQKIIMSRLNAMDVDRATIAAGRFTSMDWVTAKASIDAALSAADKRIFKLESAAERIDRSLDRIENKLGTK